MARPRIEISKDEFENLCSLMCTLKEIAGWFKCSEDTIERWCIREYDEGFADCYKKHSAGGTISLRRMQYKSAEGGNVTMQIWLGKQWLGQREKIETSNIETKDDNKLFEAIQASALEVWDNVQAIQHETDADNDMVGKYGSE